MVGRRVEDVMMIYRDCDDTNVVLIYGTPIIPSLQQAGWDGGSMRLGVRQKHLRKIELAAVDY